MTSNGKYLDLINKLKERRGGSSNLPPIQSVDPQLFVALLQDLLFAQFGNSVISEARVETMVREATALAQKLREPDHVSIDQFLGELPSIQSKLFLDADAICSGDPAAKSVDEVIITYPGFFAITLYRFAHALKDTGMRLLPRVLTEYAHRLTGIDIHPGAEIGDSFCIDHGTGIVIGETTEVGNHVKIYQGVTLGALSVTKDKMGKKRHPTVEDRVVIYANATVLGGETVIGHDSIIGGSVWLTRSIPPNSTIYHKGDFAIQG